MCSRTEVRFEDVVVGELNDRARHFVSNFPLQTPMPHCRTYPHTRLKGTGLVGVHDLVPVPVPPLTRGPYPRGFPYPCRSLLIISPIRFPLLLGVMSPLVIVISLVVIIVFPLLLCRFVVLSPRNFVHPQFHRRGSLSQPTSLCKGEGQLLLCLFCACWGVGG